MEHGEPARTVLHDATDQGSVTCTMSILFIHLGEAMVVCLA
jgi:hypothetical protein